MGVFSTEAPMFGFDENKKKIFTICSIAYALLILLVVIITNFEEFANFYNRLNSMLSVLSPILIGGMIAYFCTTLVRFFQNRFYKKIKSNRTRRLLSIVSAYALILLVAFLFLLLIIPQLIQSLQELIENLSDGTYWQPVFNSMDRILDAFSNLLGEDVLETILGEGTLSEIIATEGGNESIAVEGVSGTGGGSKAILNKIISELFTNTKDILAQFTTWASLYVGKILNGAKNVLLGFLLSIYFVLAKEKLYAQSNRLLASIFSKKKAETIIDWFRFADKTMGGFIVGKLTDATLIIVLCSIIFSIAKIPYSVLISVIIGVCNIIPFFGPFIGAIPCGFIVFIADPKKLLLYIILIIIIQQIDGNIIEPKIVGDQTGLSSLGVLVAVTIMSGYFGVLGMFLGVPIFAILCAIIKKNIKNRLAKKNMPTDLASYYSSSSLAVPYEEKEHLTAKMFRVSGTFIVTYAKKIKGLFSKKSASSPSDESTDDTEKKDTSENQDQSPKE